MALPSTTKRESQQADRVTALQTPTFSVGAESGGNTIDVTIQLRDRNGVPLAEVGELEVWLSDAAKGAVVAAAPSGGWSAQASAVLLAAVTANKHGFWLSHTDGKVTVRLVEAGAKTLYVNARIPGDQRIVSQVVTFV